MKNTVKYMLMAAILVVALVVAYIGYGALSEKYQQGGGDGAEIGTTGTAETEMSGTDRTGNGETTRAKEKEPIQTETVPAETEAKAREQINDAPDFTVLDADGNTVRLSDFFGKPIVINFWATWCPSCRNELPAFNKLSKELGDDVVFMIVNLTDGSRDTVSGVKSFIKSGGYSFPVYYDTSYSASRAYRVSSIPLTIFIESNGSVYDTYLGSMSENTLRRIIGAIID